MQPRNLLSAIAFAALAGCATYQTPGAGVALENLEHADIDIADLMKVEPAAPFPARIAVARVQASGYSSRSNTCYGYGQFCVVTTRDIEPEDTYERLSSLPLVEGIAPLNRMLIPAKLTSMKELRLAAAALKADMLLAYSLDTSFNVENTDVGPLALISLGFLPNKKAKVASTASAVIFDVRTGFIYGAAESTAVEQQRATFWSSSEAIDNARKKAESEAFQKLAGEVTRLWNSVLKAHVDTRAPAKSPGRREIGA